MKEGGFWLEKKREKMFWRKPVLILLFLTVLAPIVLYTDRLGSFFDPRSNLLEQLEKLRISFL